MVEVEASVFLEHPQDRASHTGRWMIEVNNEDAALVQRPEYRVLFDSGMQPHLERAFRGFGFANDTIIVPQYRKKA